MIAQLNCSLVVLAICTAPVTAIHVGDVVPIIENGQIVTGLALKSGDVTSPVFVFASVFGDSGFPGFTDEPGFDAPPGTFPPGSSVGFNVLDGWKVWNGDGLDPTDQTLTISFLSLAVVVADEPVDGFSLAVQPNGAWHRHLNFVINGIEGDAPLPGIYLLALELYNTEETIKASDPFWFVFNNEMPEADHQAAIDWVNANLAVEPSCAADVSPDGDGDGIVNAADLAALLASWGPCPGCATDLTGDKVVGAADLANLLADWGQCARK